MTALLPLRADSYQPHALHASDRVWTETNCYVDVWIEVLHALGLDPLAGAAFPLSTDFEGDQWTFFKYPPEDLRAAYGLEVSEMNVWRPVLDHVLEQLDLGRLLTVEVDSWFLPDTYGVSYQLDHVKSTIVPNLVDVEARRLGYFHNAGYFELEGDDFDGVFRTGRFAGDPGLPPYVELVRLERVHRDESTALAAANALLREHVSRRPSDNPVPRMAKRIEQDLSWLRGSDVELFHQYAFGVCRQCGASAETAAAFLHWLAERSPDSRDRFTESAVRWQSLAEAAKSLQFTLARVARGRNTDVGPILESMANDWQAAMAVLADAA